MDKILNQKLGENVFVVDQTPHITVDTSKCGTCRDKPCLICPVKNFRIEEAEGKAKLVFSHEGCVECGTCRFICPYDMVSWNYPRGGYGICYQRG